MSAPDPMSDLRLEVVDLRSQLRWARQDLARKKRAVARTVTLSSSTAKEREVEREALIYEHPEVMALEDRVLELQHQEETAVARLENLNRVFQHQNLLVREKLGDGLMEFATSVAHSPVAHLSLAAAASYADREPQVADSVDDFWDLEDAAS